jgi:rubredoxin
MGWSLAKIGGANWARKNAGETCRDLTEKEKGAIKKAISDFYLKGGTTLGDVSNKISKYVGEERANVIAVTEITRATANVQQLEGEDLQKQGVDMYKFWETRKDDLVCPVCKSLFKKQVGIYESFADGIFISAAHDGCR